jgi:hypothetical protein
LRFPYIVKCVLNSVPQINISEFHQFQKSKVCCARVFQTPSPKLFLLSSLHARSNSAINVLLLASIQKKRDHTKASSLQHCRLT